jgi:siderophore synthetase component
MLGTDKKRKNAMSLNQQASINRRADKRLADEAFHAYVEWLDESDAVWDAYSRWAGATHADATLAFAAYRAALEREEHASDVYATLVMQLPSGTPIHPGPRTASPPASEGLRPWRR